MKAREEAITRGAIVVLSLLQNSKTMRKEVTRKRNCMSCFSLSPFIRLSQHAAKCKLCFEGLTFASEPSLSFLFIVFFPSFFFLHSFHFLHFFLLLHTFLRQQNATPTQPPTANNISIDNNHHHHCQQDNHLTPGYTRDPRAHLLIPQRQHHPSLRHPCLPTMEAYEPAPASPRRNLVPEMGVVQEMEGAAQVTRRWSIPHMSLPYWGEGA